MRTYYEVISELENLKKFPTNSSFYNYASSDSPNELRFSYLFQFGQEFLDRKDLNISIKKYLWLVRKTLFFLS